MKFSYQWLNEYFNGKLPAPEEVAEKIGLHSFELEGVEKLENGDTVIEWDILPNRSSDCLCYDGIVKEIGTIFDLEYLDVIHETKNIIFDTTFKTSDFVDLEIKEPTKILRASKRMAVDVKIGPSPEWLVKKLAAMEQKSINNVVDITNYVMLVTGQPVHAFDYDKLAGAEPKTITIHHAKNGEKIIDLSGEEHELDDKILVIADKEKSLDIAGIKGGEISGVDENTTRVLMSAVNFEYENIRNTARKLKMQTDASKRYENEVPIYKVAEAQKLFGYLMQEVTGAKVAEEMIDTKPEILEREKIIISLIKINSLLGTNLSAKEVGDIFKRLKFEFLEENEIFTVQPTLARLDVTIPEDLIEEVGRIYGYENLAEIAPEEGFPMPTKNKVKEVKNKIGDTLVPLGFFEVYNRTIVKKGPIKLANSLNANATCLRENLLENLLLKTEKNLTHSDEPKLFEIGKVFTGVQGGVVAEHYSFAGVIGKRKIKEKMKADIFYQTKGVLEKVLEVLNLKNVVWQNIDENNFIAEILINEEKIGKVGLNFWEINLEKMVAQIQSEINYQKVSKYPKIQRDVAFWVPADFTVMEAEKIIQTVLPAEAIDLKLFDIYEDKGKNKKSFAFNIILQSPEKTLSDDFANKVMEKVYEELKKNNFEIR